MKRRNQKKNSIERKWLIVIGCGTLMALIAFIAVFHNCFTIAPTSTKASFLVWKLISHFIHI